METAVETAVVMAAVMAAVMAVVVTAVVVTAVVMAVVEATEEAMEAEVAAVKMEGGPGGFADSPGPGFDDGPDGVGFDPPVLTMVPTALVLPRRRGSFRSRRAPMIPDHLYTT